MTALATRLQRSEVAILEVGREREREAGPGWGAKRRARLAAARRLLASPHTSAREVEAFLRIRP